MTGRLRLGRLQVYLDTQDWWIGLYRPDDRHAAYVCPLPTLVLRWERWPAEPTAPDVWSWQICGDCGLPDLHRGQGDGIGSCDCPRCECGDPGWACDGHDDDLDDDEEGDADHE